MAKASKKISKISDKLAKINENFVVYMYDNGFMFEVSGKDGEDNYVTTKIMCNSIEEVLALVTEAANMERDS